MHEALCMLAAAVLALLGFALLALSQERHFETVYAAPLPATHLCSAQRGAGFTLICISLPVCVASQGPGLGGLLWLVLISAAAMAVAFTLTWRPMWLRVLTIAIQPFLGSKP